MNLPLPPIALLNSAVLSDLEQTRILELLWSVFRFVEQESL